MVTEQCVSDSSTSGLGATLEAQQQLKVQTRPILKCKCHYLCPEEDLFDQTLWKINQDAPLDKNLRQLAAA